jgi:hypothetical protein
MKKKKKMFERKVEGNMMKSKIYNGKKEMVLVKEEMKSNGMWRKNC